MIVLEPHSLFIIGQRAQAQPDLFLCLVHLDDLEIVFFPDREHRIVRPAVTGARHFRAMAQRLDAGREFHEDAEVHRAADPPMHDIADVMRPEERFPRIRLQLFNAQR